MTIRGALHRWRTLSNADRLVLVEALVALAGARALLLVCSFPSVRRAASGRLKKEERSAEVRAELAKHVRWSVVAWAGRVPWRAECFEQGLAVHWMLRRRGVPTVLHFGARQDRDALSAHVWVSDGDRGIVGHENASDFALLARFPPDGADGRLSRS